MTLETWFQIGGRITTNQPVDLDAFLFTEDTSASCEKYLTSTGGGYQISPASVLWSLELADHITIGIRVNHRLKTHVEIASRLIAMACERNIVPIIFSSLQNSGFEQFGFRVERLFGATDSDLEQCEEELKRFWNIDIVVDAENVLQLR